MKLERMVRGGNGVLKKSGEQTTYGMETEGWLLRVERYQATRQAMGTEERGESTKQVCLIILRVSKI